jgi:catechol 2,3-dioxygenase-like lactoylglutathione lyase family enzyme
MILDHTIVPSHNKIAAAQHIADLFGLSFAGAQGHFAPVRVNESLCLDFDDAEGFQSHHYAFKVSDEEFDQVLARVQAAGIAYGSRPGSQDDMQLNQRRGGRGFYFRDADGHSWELLTR